MDDLRLEQISNELGKLRFEKGSIFIWIIFRFPFSEESVLISFFHFV